MNKKLKRSIEKKLEKLSQLLDQISEAQIIDSDDSDTWDSDTLYSLVEDLKEALALLEDQESPKEKDQFGEPIVLEPGLCSLMDDYQSPEEEEDD